MGKSLRLEHQLVLESERWPRLTDEEEEALGTAIALQREEILRTLRAVPDMVFDALQNNGRGLVHPDDDFREREVLRILRHVRRLAGKKNSSGREDALSTRLESLLVEYRVLRDRMMNANLRLVFALARRHPRSILPFLDLVQEGTLGLMRAVEKFDVTRGFKFGTYATWWIWQQMARAADSQGPLIHVPVHWSQLRRRELRAHGEATIASNIEPQFDRNQSNERTVLNHQPFHCISLATPLGNDGDRTLEDCIASDRVRDPQEESVDADLGRRLAAAIDDLPTREAEILRMRFGMGGVDSFTLAELGERFGVSRERIRQLEARALKRMRNLCNDRGISIGTDTLERPRPEKTQPIPGFHLQT